jgi:hypothetical protein
MTVEVPQSDLGDEEYEYEYDETETEVNPRFYSPLMDSSRLIRVPG